jgi:dynein heavy chain
VEKIPAESPSMFGMHPNAEINFLMNQSEMIFNSIIEIQGGGKESGSSQDVKMI